MKLEGCREKILNRNVSIKMKSKRRKAVGDYQKHFDDKRYNFMVKCCVLIEMQIMCHHFSVERYEKIFLCELQKLLADCFLINCMSYVLINFNWINFQLLIAHFV